MEAFPFTEAEWAAVSEAALPVVNAGLAEDAVLRASAVVGLLDVLANLRARHGDHPVLLETEADFTENDEVRIHLYRRAARTAAEHGLPTLSIRLSLAQTLLDLNRPVEAREELTACREELTGADESDRESWSGIMAESSRRTKRCT